MAKDSKQSNLANRLEQTLLQSALEDKQLVRTINSLLHRSVEYGRASRVLGEAPTEPDCQEYIQQVIRFYQKHHVFVTCLERRDQAGWIMMIPKIRSWANSYLRNHHIDDPLRTKCIEECVPNAVLAFLGGVYHYDTEFDAWFCVLVQNVCRKYIKEQMRSNRVLEKEAVSVDQVGFMLEQLADVKELDSRKIRELRADLLEATKQLSSEARQGLIISYYFSGLSFKQISKEMDKSMSAIYKLHFDALKELRGILEDN